MKRPPAGPPSRLALLLLLLPLGLAAPARGRAQTDSLEATRRQEREQAGLETQKKQELEDIRRRAAESREAAGRLKGQESRVLAQLRKVERDLGLTRRRLRQLELRRRALDRELGATQQALTRNLQSLNDQRELLAHRLRRMYMLGASRELEFLLSTRSFAELMARWDYLVLVARQDRSLLDDITQRKEQVEATQQQIEGSLTAIRHNESQKSRETRQLDALRRERAQSVEQIRTQRQAFEAAAGELERTARQIQKLLSQLEARRRGAGGRETEPYTGEFAKGRGSLDWPVRGKITGQFGPETHPRFGTTTLNNGIDIETAVGSPVRAVARGRVDYVSEEFGTYGQIVILNHGDGYYTLYGHLSEILVAVGQGIQAAQVIARSGDTGSLKGPVLHFEVRKGGTPLNPEDWLQ